MSDGHLSTLLIFFIRDFLVLSRDVTEALKTAGYLPDINGSTRTETPSPESPGPSGLDEEGRYRLALSPLQYEGLEFASKIFLLKIFSINDVSHQVTPSCQRCRVPQPAALYGPSPTRSPPSPMLSPFPAVSLAPSSSGLTSPRCLS